MIFAFLAFLVVMFAGAVLIQWIAQHESYVLIAVDQTSIEMSLWLAVLIIFAGIGALWFGRLLWRGTFSGITRQFSRFANSAERRASHRANEGLALFLEGNWRAALNLLQKSLDRSEQPLVVWLTAAQSAQKLGDSALANELLTNASQEFPKSQRTLLVAKARLLLAADDFNGVVDLLEKADKSDIRQPTALYFLQLAYRHLGEWQKLAQLLPEIERHQALPSKELDALALEVHRCVLTALKEDGADTLRSGWLRVPAKWREHPDLLVSYIDLLIESDLIDDAESLLLKSLSKQWQADLVCRLGLLKGGQPKRRLQKADTWLKDHAESPELLLALGRISAANELWGKARDYWETGYRLEPRDAFCIELIRLFEALGEPLKAEEYRGYLIEPLLSGLPAQNLSIAASNRSGVADERTAS